MTNAPHTTAAPLACAPLAGSHSDDRVTVHAGAAPQIMCGRHAHGLTPADHATISAARSATDAAVLTAAYAFAARVDVYTATDIGPALTCSEADALAALLTATGHDEPAAALMESHRRDDAAAGDPHYTDDDE